MALNALSYLSNGLHDEVGIPEMDGWMDGSIDRHKTSSDAHCFIDDEHFTRHGLIAC